MRVLLAGGLGFIGSHVRKHLEELRIDCKVIDLKAGDDICFYDASNQDFDAIILLAADLGRDIEMYHNNLRIYQWAARQTTHMVYTSSAAVYEDLYEARETDTPNPPSLYGKSKLLGEDIIKATQPSYTILRLSNVFGTGDGNGAIDAFKRGAKTIFGDGKDVRDYVSVTVVAKAIVKAAMNPEKYRNETYNTSTHIPMTTNEAFKKYGKGEAVHLEPRHYDARFSLLDNRKAIEAGLI